MVLNKNIAGIWRNTVRHNTKIFILGYMDVHVLQDANNQRMFILLAFEEAEKKVQIRDYACSETYMNTTYCVKRYIHIHHTNTYTNHAYRSYTSYTRTYNKLQTTSHAEIYAQKHASFHLPIIHMKTNEAYKSY